MKVTDVKKMEKNEVSLTVEVKGEAFEKATEAAYRKSAKQIRVPGFRPGKATRKQIEALYGEGVFFDDAIKALYPDALEQAIAEKKLDVIDLKDINVESVDKEGFVFTAIVIVKPEAKVKKYKGIKAEKNVYTVTSSEVDAALKTEQKKAERVVSVDREIKSGDIAVIDYEGFLGDKAFDGGKGEDYELEIGSGTFIPGFEDQLIGKKKDENVDVNVTFPEEYHAEELKGKAVVFKVAVKDVREKQLPELDDEFVKDISEFDTLADFKKDIKKKIKERKEKTAESELENALLDALVDKTEVEIPDAMIQKQIDNIVRDFDGRLQMQGMKLDMYLKYTGMTMESFRAGFTPEAEKQVKVRLALEAIVKAESIEVSDKELEAEYKKLADLYQMEVDQIKPYIPADELKMDTAVGKALDVVKANAEITEKKVEAEKKTTAKKTTSTAKKTTSTAKKTTTTTKKTTTSTTKKTTAAKTTTAAKKPAAKKTTAKKETADK